MATWAQKGTGIFEGKRHVPGLRMASPFFASDNIPAETCKGVAAVYTLAVGAQWVTSDKADAETVYQITTALFSEATQKTLQPGHAKGKMITLKNAVQGVGANATSPAPSKQRPRPAGRSRHRCWARRRS